MDKRPIPRRTLFLAALKMGLTSFGGPLAHLGYFQREYVERRGWLDHATYIDTVALCQFLPGPASSQVGMSVGLRAAGVRGAMVSWLGFTMPSVILMALLSLGLAALPHEALAWLGGLRLVALAVVAQAVMSMWPAIVRGRRLAAITFGTIVVLSVASGALGQIAALLGAALAGWLLFKPHELPQRETGASHDGRFPHPAISIACLVSFGALLVLLPVAARVFPDRLVVLADIFYRAGSLVFGGGHVVMPLLQQDLVPAGLVELGRFMDGYALAQAMPGPMFSFSSFLGMEAAGIAGAAVCSAAVFLPSFLLVVGVLPHWQRLRSIPALQGAMAGVNAAVMGLLVQALYTPLWTSAIKEPLDFAMALGLLLLLTIGRWPSWAVVLTALGAGALSHLFV